jgi:hypothetical protein
MGTRSVLIHIRGTSYDGKKLRATPIGKTQEKTGQSD